MTYVVCICYSQSCVYVHMTLCVPLQLSLVIKMFGPSNIIDSDNGREFVNQVMSDLASMFPGMQFIRGRPRHSQSQGSVEALNKLVERKLQAMTAETHLARYHLVDAVGYSINTTVHSATKKHLLSLSLVDRQNLRFSLGFLKTL